MIKIGALGPLLVHREGEPQTVSRADLRRLLAVLLVHAGKPIPADVIGEELWPGRPTAEARTTLHVHLSRLRRIFADGDRVVNRHGGYAIRIEADEFDVAVFERLVAAARAARRRNDPGSARETLHVALGLWRGPAYDGVRDVASVGLEADRLDGMRLDAFEEAAELDLEAGEHAAITAELTAMALAHPYRERLRGQQMLALYRSGRQAEALAAYRQAYEQLIREIGVEPGPELRRLHQAMLAGDPAVDQMVTGHAGISMLPRATVHFTGRSALLAVLDEIADAGGPASPVAVLSAVTGSAGVGKTALAIHWARTAAARFPDGQLYINLQGYGGRDPLSPFQALSHLLEVLGVPRSELPDSEQTAVARYRALLAERRLLVVLDNANSARQVRPLLPAGSHCMAVVTSRDRLAGLVALDGAHSLHVDVLTVDEAAAMLATLLGVEVAAREPDAIAALTDACGRLPLALRIAAASVAQSPSGRVGDYVELLSGGNRLPMLAIDGDPECSVQITLEFSYRRLCASDQSMFRLLGIVPGTDLGAGAAAALAACPPDEATARLHRLCEASLLSEIAPGRFQLHDLIREYAQRLAVGHDDASVRETALTNLLAWYCAHANNADGYLQPQIAERPWIDRDIDVQPFATAEDALAWYDLEGPNVVAAIRQSESVYPDRCWQLTEVLFPWLQRQRSVHEWLEVYRVGLRAAVAVGSATGESAMASGIAIALAYSGRQGEAQGYFQRALALRRASGEPRQIVTALINLGGVLGHLNQADAAIQYLEEAARVAETEPSLADRRPGILLNIAFAHMNGSDPEKAVPFYEQTIAAAEDYGHPLAIAAASNALGVMAMKSERFDEARSWLERSLAAATAGLHRMQQGHAHRNLGHVAALQGEFDDARAHLAAAMEIDPDGAVFDEELRTVIAERER